MSDAVSRCKTDNKIKKKKKKKRSASSPLNESGRPTKLADVNVNGANHNGNNGVSVSSGHGPRCKHSVLAIH